MFRGLQGKKNQVGARKPRAFAWSYSRLKNYRACPHRHYRVDIKKDTKEDESEALLWGNRVHEAFAAAIDERVGKKGRPLPPDMKDYQPYVDKVVEFHDAGCKVLTEQQLAINEAFEPVDWFHKDVWFRAVVDVLILADTKAAALDWKTGKIVEDSEQLGLTAAVLFAHHPQITEVQTRFVWLKEDDESDETFYRDDMTDLWARLMPEIRVLKEAHETQDYPPRPNHLCRAWCPVTDCAHNGRRSR